MITPVSFWIILGVLLMVLEIFTPTFFVFWFGLGSLAAAVVAYFYENTVFELLTFIIVSGILVLSTRKLAKKITGEEVRSINVDEIVGKEAIVMEQIDNKIGKGVVKVSGDMWRAMSYDDDIVIPQGEKVVIEKVEGAHVVVKPLRKTSDLENLDG
ncbi:Membrane protein implicated in regulation of membrane protease activity [Fervidobacterium changbaicum]|uniref:NfeD family protein n=2 Tax=Fervidobacterium TaxID=2422 RepID=A0AAI8CLV7_FERIS|nr:MULTISPECIES: NfeD family protein [Fervidobacterium]AMW32638.1 NfeD family protein [Fervidobacterium islandicum]QAV32509.1 NfeD family protein [Fervidobacterium changbaicum]SDH50573.1 Membrane protein implicated in regulation of membrane protease activity [Fervidobacterium changbaicum]